VPLLALGEPAGVVEHRITGAGLDEQRRQAGEIGLQRREAASASGSIAVGRTATSVADLAAETTDGLTVFCGDCASTSSNVLTRGFAWSGWFE